MENFIFCAVISSEKTTLPSILWLFWISFWLAQLNDPNLFLFLNNMYDNSMILSDIFLSLTFFSSYSSHNELGRVRYKSKV